MWQRVRYLAQFWLLSDSDSKFRKSVFDIFSDFFFFLDASVVATARYIAYFFTAFRFFWFEFGKSVFFLDFFFVNCYLEVSVVATISLCFDWWSILTRVSKNCFRFSSIFLAVVGLDYRIQIWSMKYERLLSYAVRTYLSLRRVRTRTVCYVSLHVCYVSLHQEEFPPHIICSHFCELLIFGNWIKGGKLSLRELLILRNWLKDYADLRSS